MWQGLEMGEMFMKKTMLAGIFFLVAGSVFATLPIDNAMLSAQAKAAQLSIASEAMKDDSDKDFNALKDEIQSGRFYALLLSLNAEVPDVAHTAEYAMLINEMHLINQKLDTIASVLQQANVQQEQRLNKGAI